MKPFVPAVTASLFIALAFTGCDTPGQSALAGAATGAAVGGLLHGRGTDALRGAAIGAGAGYLIGKVAQHERREAYDRTYAEGSAYDDGSNYPYGRFTDRDGFVRSPYRPYHIIDVHGIPEGARVVDPSCDRIFINP